ncbi:unnamed protein product [Effrenium voratum]|nr:unnamed protein product [Effrenium voratum]
MRPGVQRRRPWQNRRDYFDSKLQVIRHLRDKGHMVVEVGEESQLPEKAKKEQPKAASPAPKKRGRPPAPKAAETPPKRPRLEDWGTLWTRLESKGWRLEVVGQRQDRYYLPPGVERGPGKKNRVDYFDSKKQVLQQLGGQ